MSRNASTGSRRPAGRLVGLLALAGLVGLLELRRGRTAPKAAAVPPLPPVPVPSPVVPRRHRGRRLARACFVCSALGAIALPVVWFNTRPVTDVGDLTGLRAAGAATATTPAAGPVGTAPAEGPAVRTFPARLQDQPLPAANRPARLQIAAIGVDATAVPVGVVAGSGLLEAPGDGETVGWYRHGPSPGEEGSALVAGHVDFGGRRGVFFLLSRLQPGAAVTVGYEDGSSRAWRVVARRQYAKDQLPTDLLFARTGPPTLALVTCGGLYDASKRSYHDNVVVFATPA